MTASHCKLAGLLTVTALLLGGCGAGSWFGSSGDKPLPGERIEVLMSDAALKADPRLEDMEVSLPRPEANEDWPQAGGMPNHAMHHLAATGDLSRLWRSSIGDGSGSEAQLLAQPVVADGRVYTMDISAEVRAFDAETGSRLWSVSLGRDGDYEGIRGGGLAVHQGRVYATTGFAHVVALNAENGDEIWRRPLPGPIRAAPTVWDGRVFAVTVTNETFALATDDGRQLWTHAGLTEVAGLVGGAAPAVDAGVVVVPYSSGEVVALRVENGRVVWTETLAAVRRADAVTAIAHIRGRPVIDRGIVYIVGHSQRTVAVDLRTGTRLWEVPVGGLEGPWVAGEFLYLVTREGQLICLTRRGGRVRWVTQLPRFEDEEDQVGPILWAGPVLAGDRLILANSEEEVWSVSPYTGRVLGRIDVSEKVLIAPAVARETLYLLTDNADLIALR
ncbi:MAG: PQQ-binding-like beta-propeller repeat protein [Rhodospirillaceae bacterium]